MYKSKLGFMLVAVASLVLGSCSSDSPPVMEKDSAVEVDQAVYEDYGVYPDQYVPPPQPDFQWPDTQPVHDSWPTPKDAYSGTPFGCESDADCFGRVCCPTPWGVKLCVEECPD